MDVAILQDVVHLDVYSAIPARTRVLASREGCAEPAIPPHSCHKCRPAICYKRLWLHFFGRRSCVVGNPGLERQLAWTGWLFLTRELICSGQQVMINVREL